MDMHGQSSSCSTDKPDSPNSLGHLVERVHDDDGMHGTQSEDIPEVIQATCSICLSDSGSAWHSISCGHAFHTDCIVKWLRTSNSCPMCRDNGGSAVGDESAETALDLHGGARAEHDRIRRRHRNYVCRRNKLARDNSDVGGMRENAKLARDDMESKKANLFNILDEAEKRILSDPSVRDAKKMHSISKRKYHQAQSRYLTVAESFLGPEPHLPPPQNLLGILQISVRPPR